MYIVFFSKVQDQQDETQAMTTISQESNFTGN
jgi:hypothetical protein